MFVDFCNQRCTFVLLSNSTILKASYLTSIYNTHREDQLQGRWITLDHIQPIFSKYDESLIQYERIGESERKRSVYEFTLGKGPKKVFIWTQMHGNESTGTKAVFDLLNFLHDRDDEVVHDILANCTIKINPILNPDGAQVYSRLNANKVDLNRDAVKRVAKESQLLRNRLEDFHPEFCFNLHDQRTIFGVSGTDRPATISFLAPSEEVTRKLTDGRKKTMNVIAAMNKVLQEMIPNHVGRYTDEFYPTATGDNFQKLGYSTILIESGHYPNDYDREITREYTFYSLLKGIHHIATSDSFDEYESYFDIPDNSKNFRDLIHRYEKKKDQVFQYEETLENGAIKFIPIKVKGDISGLFFHKEIVFVD